MKALVLRTHDERKEVPLSPRDTEHLEKHQEWMDSLPVKLPQDDEAFRHIAPKLRRGALDRKPDKINLRNVTATFGHIADKLNAD